MHRNNFVQQMQVFNDLEHLDTVVEGREVVKGERNLKVLSTEFSLSPSYSQLYFTSLISQ